METITLLNNKETSDGHLTSRITLQANRQISSALETAFSAYSSSEPLAEQLTEDGLLGEFLHGGESTILRLSRDGFEWIGCSRHISRTVELSNVITVTHEEPKSSRFCFGLCNNDDDGFHKLVIHSFERNRKSSAIWTSIRFTFASSDKLQITQWSEKANKLISHFKERPKQLWVFVNPFGGARQAPVIWKNQIKPLFELAGIQSHVVITKEANEAQELMRTTPKEALDSLDGVIAVGGDGLFQEIMNGMLERSTNPWSETGAINQSLRLGHIPAGSTDAVAWSVNGSRCPVSAALRIVFGDRMSLDVMNLKSEDSPSSRYSACLAGYGFMGDVISMSEHLRVFGPMRYDLAGVMAFFSHNSHRARVSYMRSTENETFEQVQSSTDWHKETESTSGLSIAESGVEIVEDEFISIMITVNPCRSDKSPNGLIPHAQLSDGRLHVTLVKTCSRCQYLSFLVSAAKHGIRPGQFPFVQTIDAKWVKVEPLDSQSSWNVDGEVLRHQGLTSMVYNGLIQVFARGVEQ